MIQKNKRILYLYTGDHAVHRKMAESIGANILPLSWSLPKDYDIYISEGDYFKLSILKLLGRIKRNQKIVVLFSDPRLFYLNTRRKLDVFTQKLVNVNLLKIILSKYLINRLDGAICLSKFEEKMLKAISPKLKNVTHYPFIEKNLFKRLLEIRPSIEGNNILFVGNGPDWYYKGIDRIVSIATQNPSYNFIIIGGNWERFTSEHELPKNILFEGLKKPEDLRRYFKESVLYLHLGRGEAFGVSIAEAMASGLPCIVSDQTGAKEFVEKVSPRLVVQDNTPKINETLNDYFSLDRNKKIILSKKFKKISKNLEEGRVIKEYKVKLKDFIRKL